MELHALTQAARSYVLLVQVKPIVVARPHPAHISFTKSETYCCGHAGAYITSILKAIIPGVGFESFSDPQLSVACSMECGRGPGIFSHE